MKKRRKAERGRAGKREGAEPRSAAPTSDDRALQESEAKFRSLVENTAAPIGITNLTGDFTYVNKTLADLTGYTVQEMVSRPFIQFLHPEDRQKVLGIFTKGASTAGEAPEIEFRVKRRDGQILTLTSKPTRFEIDGKTVGFQAIITDITDRKRTEEALRESEEKYRLIAENMTETIWLMDMNLKPTYISPSAVPLRGYTLEELYALPIDRQLTPDSLKLAWETFKEALSEENLNSKDAPTSITLELQFYRKDGSTFWNESTFTLVRNSKGEPAGILGVGREITERKRMEEALREGEQRYRMMFENMSSAAAVYEAVDDSNDFIFKDFNSAAERIEKMKREQLIGKGVLEIFPGLRDSGLFDVFQRVWRTGTPEHHPTMFYKDNRISGWRENYVYRLPSGEVISIYEDVTERERAEEELRKLNQFRESIIENANIWIDVLDENANIVMWNKAAELISGYSREEVVGHGKIWEWLYPDEEYRKELKDFVADVIQRGRVDEDFETKITRKDGQIRIISWNERNLTDENGKAIGSIAIGRDATERKRMEEELKRYSTGLERLVLERTKELAESEKRLRYAVALNPAVIYTGKPLPDYSDWVMTYVSERVVTMLGFDPSEFIGHPEFWRHHIHPDDSRLVLAEMPRLWKEGQLTVEYRFLHKDGAYRWIREETEVVREVNGKPVEVDGYWTDITERKRMEARLAESQRLAGIGEAAAMVGHDLRNPLQGIVSTVYLAKRKLESPPQSSREAAVKPGLVDMLETIENEAEYMDKIVSDLQDYAAPLKAEPKPVEMEPLVEDTLSKIRTPQNVKVSFKVSEPLPTVMIDPAVMRRVFSNLIMNAIQAMPDGGELTIDLSRTEEHLLVSFRDTGVGIPEEKVDKLFNPFFTTKAKGQGLGLAVCKRLAEAHNGRITVESKPGEGSTFTVKLPIIKP